MFLMERSQIHIVSSQKTLYKRSMSVVKYDFVKSFIYCLSLISKHSKNLTISHKFHSSEALVSQLNLYITGENKN